MNLPEIRQILIARIRRPSLTLAVVLSLSLGIGVNTALFSIVNQVLISSMPGVEDPDQLVVLAARPITIPGLPGPLRPAVSYPFYRELKEANRAFSDLATFHSAQINLQRGIMDLAIQASFVSDSYFSTLSIRPYLGHLIGDSNGQEGVAVISHRLWRRLFGENAQAVGRKIQVNGQPFSILGVAPTGFRGTWIDDRIDLWIPLKATHLVLSSLTEDQLRDPNHQWLLWMVGRMANGVNTQQARVEMDGLVQELKTERRPSGIEISQGISFRPGDRSNSFDYLLILTGLAGLVFLAACANAANLHLVWEAERRTEAGVRMALGAHSGEILKRYLVEGLVTALLGGAGAFALAFGVTRLLRGVSLARFLPPLDEISTDLRVLGFTLILALVAGTMIGLLAALRTSRATPASLLLGTRGVGGGDQRLSKVFVALQIAVSLTLLIGAALLMRTFQNLSQTDLGFQSGNLINLRLDLSQRSYPGAVRNAFWEGVLGKISRVPGVDSVTLASNVPLNPRGEGNIGEVRASHRTVTDWLAYNVVGPTYFDTLGIQVLSGRGFTFEDRAATQPVAVVNQTLATEYWPGGQVVGREIRVGGQACSIIGVVRDIKLHSLEGIPEPYFYLPLLQQAEEKVYLQVKSTKSLELLETLRSEIRSLDSTVLILEITRMEHLVGQALSTPRLAAALVSFFSLLALALAAIGLYAVTAESVAQRLPELGIRMALGGRRRTALVLAFKTGLVPITAGLILGYSISLLGLGSLRPLLYGVEPFDPISLAAFPLILVAVVFLSILVAAWPALRAQPLEMLRRE